jgi:cell division protein FtsB
VRRLKLTGRAVALAVVAAVLIVSYASSLRAWLDQRSEVALLQSQISERREAIAAMQAELRRWEDPAYVETQARERFGWVMPGETGYRVVGLDGQPLGAADGLGGLTQSAAVTKPDWWTTVWGSVVAAGREERARGDSRRQPVTRIGPARGGQHADTSGVERPPGLVRHLPAEQW